MDNSLTVDGTLHRYAAFTTTPSGGNPAGVWIGDVLPSPVVMQRIAADVGYSETAFIAPSTGFARQARYFSPLAEVPFCGHATIASGVVLGEHHGDGIYQFATRVGEVPVHVGLREGRREAALTSVTPRHEAASAALIDASLAALHWNRSELDRAIPVVRAFAGAWHLVIAVATRERLTNLAYAFDELKELMQARDLTTLQLVWRERADCFHARNPFPIGGIFEDPATGAAAAALGGYLRDAGLLDAPATIAIRQGDDMGRPSRIGVHIPASGGIVVSGGAVDLATD